MKSRPSREVVVAALEWVTVVANPFESSEKNFQTADPVSPIDAVSLGAMKLPTPFSLSQLWVPISTKAIPLDVQSLISNIFVSSRNPQMK